MVNMVVDLVNCQSCHDLCSSQLTFDSRREKVYSFLLQMKETTGTLQVFSVVNILDDKLVANLRNYIASCQIYEGGIAGEPGCEALGGVLETPACGWCEGYPQTVMHILRDCPVSSAVWHLLVPAGWWFLFCKPVSLREWFWMNVLIDRRTSGANSHWLYIFRQTVHEL